MADRVFIADYIKKKRRRKGSYEFLVKWKGYSTRHCTWEPRENILDSSLIKQFEEEGYDPRRVRVANRKKKRRRSEITEARPLTLPFSDSDSEHDPQSPPADLRSSNKNKVSPISLSKYGGEWQADATNKKRATLFENDAERDTEQKKRKIELDALDYKENAIKLHETTHKEISTLYQNGGKSCHPKMRAKFMFRTGDFENVDWGYDWSSSDNESLKENVNKESSTNTQHSSEMTPLVTPLKRKRHDSFSSEFSSVSGESTIPAIEELESPFSFKEHEWNAPSRCMSLDNSYIRETYEPIKEEEENMPTLTNENITIKTDSANMELAECEGTDETQRTGTETEIDKTKPETDKHREDVFVTEVTLENLTVIIHESTKMKGFFRWQT